MGANRSETTPKRGLSARKPSPGTQDRAARAPRERFEPFFRTSLPTSDFKSSRTSQSKVLGLPRPTPMSPGFRPRPDDAAGACRLNFVTKPPSSGGGTSPLAVLERARIPKTSSQDIRRGYRDDS